MEGDPRIRQSLFTSFAQAESVRCGAAFASEEEALAPPWASAREVKVLELLVRDFTCKETAAELAISHSTVHTHV